MKTAISLVNYHLESKRSAPGNYALSCAFKTWIKATSDSSIKDVKPRLRHLVQIFTRSLKSNAFLLWRGPLKNPKKDSNSQISMLNYSVQLTQAQINLQID
jgi:hypothetical protein